MLEFFDYFLIGFVVAFIAAPWKLTFGESAIILLASGCRRHFRRVFYGWLADKIGRRKTFILTVVNFSVATGALAFTPDGAWLFLAVFRFIIGFGTGGLYCVDLPLVQEFVPSSKRGHGRRARNGVRAAGNPDRCISGRDGHAVHRLARSFRDWACTWPTHLLIRAWVPESPRWLMRHGTVRAGARVAGLGARDGSRRNSADGAGSEPQQTSRFRDIFRYPRSLAVAFSTNLFSQIGYYGMLLWAPTLLVQLLPVTPGARLDADDFREYRRIRRQDDHGFHVRHHRAESLRERWWASVPRHF